MDSIKSGALGCLSMFVFAAALGACVGDGGEWSPIPGPSTPPSSTGAVGVLRGSPTSPGSTIPTPVTDRLGSIACEMGPAAEIQVQHADNIPSYAGTGSQVCLGEQYGQAAPTLCWQVQAFEARAAAVASCFAAAQEELDSQGMRIMGREWKPLALPMLPPAWAKSVAHVQSLSTRVTSGLVHLLTGGKASEAAGAPVCFPKQSGLTLDEAKAQAVADIKALVQGTSTELSDVVTALKRGVNLEVTKDLHLKLAVQIIERQPNIEAIGTCKFHAAN